MQVLSWLGWALVGASVGAVFVPAVIFLGIRLNLKSLGTLFAGMRQGATFYRAWALFGGGAGAGCGFALPVLDASGIKDPWYGLTLMGIMVAAFVPLLRFLKRHMKRT